MRIGIDLDNTINENDNTVLFFSMLTKALKGKADIFIITNRDSIDRDSTIRELKLLNIYYDYLCLTAEKSKLVIDENITVYFDNTDEYFLDLPESVTVFKIRESGNFSFDAKKWIYGDKTGLHI